MKFRIDRTKTGITYSPSYLINRFGSENVYRLFKEAYALEFMDDGVLVHVFTVTKTGTCIKTRTLSPDTRKCIQFELAWLEQETKYLSRHKTAELTGEMPEPYRETRYSKTSDFSMRRPVKLIAPKAYGWLVYLVQSISGEARYELNAA